TVNGTPGYNLYLVGIQGNATETNNSFPPVEGTTVDRTPIGVVNLVADLSASQIGNSGLFVIRHNTFAYWSTAPSGVNELVLPDGTDFGATSRTYALILSPTAIALNSDLATTRD